MGQRRLPQREARERSLLVAAAEDLRPALAMGGLGHVAGDPHRRPPVATGERGLETDGLAVVARDDDHFGGVGAVGRLPGDDRGPAHRQRIGAGHGHGPVELVDGDDVVDDRPRRQREPVALDEDGGVAGREPGQVAAGDRQAGRAGRQAEVAVGRVGHRADPADGDGAVALEHRPRPRHHSRVHLVEVHGLRAGGERGVGPAGATARVGAGEHLGRTDGHLGLHPDPGPRLERRGQDAAVGGLAEVGVDLADPEGDGEGVVGRRVVPEDGGALTQPEHRNLTLPGRLGVAVGHAHPRRQRRVEGHDGVRGHERHRVGG